MKRFRLLLVVALVAAVGLAGVLAVAFTPRCQTWAARKYLASRPDLRVTVGGVAAGLKRVHLRDLRFEQEGAVLTVPALEVELPIWSAAWRERVIVSRLVARGWTLDASKLGRAVTRAATREAEAGAAAPAANAKAARPNPAAEAGRAFAGVFARLRLPVDLALDGVDLSGDVILPAARGRAHVTLGGGGLAAGREGRFELVAQAALADPKVNEVALNGVLSAAMDTPRTFTGIAVKLQAAARGAQFPQGVKLAAELIATRPATGEAYSLAVVTEGRELLRLHADFPRDARRLDGTWKLDVRDADVMPFALGQPLPAFTAAGEGRFDADAAFSAVHVLGRLEAATNRLERVLPQLAALGEMKVAADFDLAKSGDAIAVRSMEAVVSGAQPIATMRALQAFEFSPATGEVRAGDAARELLGVVLQGVPVAWARPFLTGTDVTGGVVRGELVASPRGGGIVLHSTAPLTVDGVTVAQAGQPLVERIDISLSASADYTPRGWQAEVNGFTAKTGGATLVTLDAKAGRLAGAGHALKTTGRVSGHLPAILAQPIVRGSVALSGGDATVEFAASLDATTEVHANVALRNLAATVDGKPAKLPALTADLRADLAPDGRIAFSAPIVLERNDRKSDVTIAGSLGPAKDNARAIDAQVTSGQLVIDDAQVFAGIVPEKKPANAAPGTNAPPWAGVHGSVALQLKKVIYGDAFEVTNVAGRVRIDAGMLKLEKFEAGLGDSGRASVDGAITFDAAAPLPYALAADVAVREFDPAGVLRANAPGQPPTIEGRFDLTSRLASRAAALADLAAGAGGEFQLTSRAGVFRGLPLNVGNLVENSSKIAGWIASAGTALSSIAGKKDYADIANKAQAVAEFARGLHPLAYDQLSVTVQRDAALNTTLRNFSLIAPEIRLTGSGTALHRSGTGVLEDSLAMEFRLRARGRQAELLKYLGLLEAQPDDFGYAACTLPLSVSGTLARPDTSELSRKFAAIALEKSGVTDKAADLVNRIFGGAK